MDNTMTTHKLSFNQQELAAIGEALHNLPYRVAAPIIASIGAQLEKAAAVAEAEADKPEEKEDKATK